MKLLCTLLAAALLAGTVGAESDLAKLERLKPKAEAGEAAAQFELAGLYERSGKPELQAEILSLHEKAARQGHEGAQLSAAYMRARGIMINGQATGPDYAGALKWFEMAAVQHVTADAQFMAGNLYDFGNVRSGGASRQSDIYKIYHFDHRNPKGFAYTVSRAPQDWKKARSYYLLAAARGDYRAHINLGVMSLEGQAIRKPDIIAAYKHLRIAAHLTESPVALMEQLKTLESKMKPAEVDLATKQADLEAEKLREQRAQRN